MGGEVVWVKYASSLLDNYHCVADLGSEKPDMGSGRPDLRSERPDLGAGRPDWRSEKPALGSVKSDLGSERPDLGSERLYLRLGGGGGRTDGRTDGRTENGNRRRLPYVES